MRTALRLSTTAAPPRWPAIALAALGLAVAGCSNAPGAEPCTYILGGRFTADELAPLPRDAILSFARKGNGCDTPDLQEWYSADDRAPATATLTDGLLKIEISAVRRERLDGEDQASLVTLSAVFDVAAGLPALAKAARFARVQPVEGQPDQTIEATRLATPRSGAMQGDTDVTVTLSDLDLIDGRAAGTYEVILFGGYAAEVLSGRFDARVSVIDQR